MTNREIAKTLEKVADILQIKEENTFKIRAYRKAAESIYHLDENLTVLYEQNKIGDIPGVGKTVTGHIEEMIEKGSLAYYEELLEEVPYGVLEMLAIPGLGHKTAKIIYENLGIDNIEDLLKAVEDKQIRELPGLGSKSEYNIKKGIELLKESYGRANLGVALPMAEEFIKYLDVIEGIEEAVIVGSARRGKPQVSDIDILVASNDFAVAKANIINYQAINKIETIEDNRVSGRLTYNVEFEIILVKPADFIYNLVWTTGNHTFRDKLLGAKDPDEFKNIPDEGSLFDLLNMEFIPPELREDEGEIELAKSYDLPELVTEQDLKGDLHIHSNWSDGACSIEEMTDACRDLGYNYMAITDHSKSLHISSGLNEERLRAEGELIDKLNSQREDFTILKGIEVDILKKGELDFSDEVLQELDLVVASIHSNFKLDVDKQTDRLLTAMKNKHVNIIGHLTGRLLNRRPAYELHMDKILDGAVKNKVVLEINSHPDRLDVDEVIARHASLYGIKLAINSDAHHTRDLLNRKFGVLSARRGWLTADDVINTWDITKLRKYLDNKVK